MKQCEVCGCFINVINVAGVDLCRSCLDDTNRAEQYKEEAAENAAYEEKEALIKWLDHPKLDDEDIMHKLNYYNDVLIFDTAKILKCDPVAAKITFQELATCIEVLNSLKNEFLEIMDV